MSTQIYSEESHYQQLQKELNNSQEVAHIGSWKWDIQNNTIKWSDEVFRIFGEEVQSFTPTLDSFLSYLSSKDKLIIQSLIDNSIKTKEPYLIEHEIIKKDGSRSYVQGSGSVQFDANGEPISITGTVFDISQNRQHILQLQESEEKFRKIAEISLMGLFIYKKTYLYVNDAFCEMTGYSREELLKQSPREFIDKSFHKEIDDNMRRRLQGEEFPHTYNDLTTYHKDGSRHIMRVLTQTIFYQGSYAGLGTIMDVTDIVQNKAKLKLLAQAMEQTDEMIRITDKDGINTYVNEALLRHTGYKEDELVGQNNRIFKSGQHPQEFYKNMWDTILAAKTYVGIFINRKKDATLYHEEMRITPILDKKGNIEHFIATSQDITLRIKLEKELKRLATTDNLTGLFNRHHTHKELDSSIAKYNRYNDDFMLLMIDIDFFKKINDEHGHDIGDYVLKEISELILKQIREGDHLGRWGGEEFMLILPRISKEEALGVADKIRLFIHHYNFHTISHLSISIGITQFLQDDTKGSLLKRVDDALYMAKDAGRNCVVFE